MYRNTDKSYGWIAIGLHWLSAVVIFFMFGLGLYLVELSYYDSWYKGSLDLHKSIGLCFVLLWFIRILWKLITPRVQAVSTESHFAHIEHKLANYTHKLLYILVIFLFVSGYLISTADGRGIEVFAMFEIPALPISFENQEDIAGEIHWILAWTLIAFVSLHALAALKHHFYDKDSTLIRMLKPSK